VTASTRRFLNSAPRTIVGSAIPCTPG
jgi:hypothetical protein